MNGDPTNTGVPPVVTPGQAEKMHEAGDSSLPPPGDEQREVLRRRREDLEKYAEQLADNAIAMKKDLFDVDREIRDPLANALTNLLPGYSYCLVCTRLDGKDVWQKKSEGWEVVSGNHPEAPNLRVKEDGTRRIGDTILMRATDEQYVKIKAAEFHRARMREAAVSSEIIQKGEDLARKTDGAVNLVMNPADRKTPHGSLLQVMERRSGARRRHPASASPRQQAIDQQAQEGVDSMLRDGTIPGMPAPTEKVIDFNEK